jgi:thiol-disulfide isomerase/thioredoxin
MIRKTILSLALTSLVVSVLGCSQRTATGEVSNALELPPAYTPELAEQYRALTDSGYQALDDGRTEEAIAFFKSQHELIPAGRLGAYNIACAYGRTEQKPEALEWLTTAVAGGWDDPEALEYDTDLESIREEPEFAALVSQAEQNRVTAGANFAKGLPEYSSAPIHFPTHDSLDLWFASQNAALRRNRSIWHGSQMTAARMDLQARRLAGLRELEKDNPEFDYGLERVRTAVNRINSIWSPWGPYAAGAQAEIDRYLAGNPDNAGRNEAEYYAGIVAYCEHRPESPEDAAWASSVTAARARFANVAAGTEYKGAAKAWLLAFDLGEAGENKESVLPQVREFAETYKDDQPAMDIAAAFFQGDCVAALWPIPIEGVDIDGEPVSLDDYRGRVVFVDFWATWCPPCRAELPHIVEAYEEYHDQGFDVLSVSLDYGDRTTQDAYREWITEKEMNWRHIYDENNWEGPLVKAFLVRSIPSPFLIGRDGSLIASGEECRGEVLDEAVAAALEQKGA